MSNDNIPEIVKAVAEYHGNIRGGVIYWVKPGENVGEEQLLIVYGRESEAGNMAGFSDVNAQQRGRDNVEYVKRKFERRLTSDYGAGMIGFNRDKKDLIDGSMLYHVTGTFGELCSYYIDEAPHAK